MLHSGSRPAPPGVFSRRHPGARASGAREERARDPRTARRSPLGRSRLRRWPGTAFHPTCAFPRTKTCPDTLRPHHAKPEAAIGLPPRLLTLDRTERDDNADIVRTAIRPVDDRALRPRLATPSIAGHRACLLDGRAAVKPLLVLKMNSSPNDARVSRTCSTGALTRKPHVGVLASEPISIDLHRASMLSLRASCRSTDRRSRRCRPFHAPTGSGRTSRRPRRAGS